MCSDFLWKSQAFIYQTAVSNISSALKRNNIEPKKNHCVYNWVYKRILDVSYRESALVNGCNLCFAILVQCQCNFHFFRLICFWYRKLEWNDFVIGFLIRENGKNASLFIKKMMKFCIQCGEKKYCLFLDEKEVVCHKFQF